MATNRRSGDINRNGQKLLRMTKEAGNDHMQYVWVLECGRDGHVYGANGSDFRTRYSQLHALHV